MIFRSRGWFLCIVLLYCSNLASSFLGSRSVGSLRPLWMSLAAGVSIEDEADDVFGKPAGVLPSVSSKVNFPQETASNIQCDLWVSGAGTLGEIVCRLYKQRNPHATVIAETATTNRHASLSQYGVTCRLRSERTTGDEKCARNVVIALPPSSASDYADELGQATRLWAGAAGGGMMVFTSSTAVYGDANENIVTEDFRLDTRSARAVKLISAEEAILQRGGSVIRLAGLYSDFRGAHTYWFKQAKEGKTIETNSNGFVNLIHYEDAARAVLATLDAEDKNRVYMAADDEPLTKLQICKAALQSNLFPDSPMPKFLSDIGPIGKRCNDELSRRLLGWKPVHSSFRKYMRAIGGLTEEDIDSTLSSTNIESSKSKKSLLWVPGDEEEGEM